MKLEFSKFLEFYGEHQDKDNKFFYEHYPKVNKDIIRSYKSRSKKRLVSNKVSPKVSKVPKSIPPNTEFSQIPFIDDPDELLMSVAIRELNRPNPDSRWANILIACKKEKITNKTNVMDQFKQLPTKALISLLKKNSLEELS